MSSYFEQDNLKDSHITLSTESKQNYNNVYCLSGLGADKRVFTKLELKGYRQIHLDWLVPNNQESLTNYVKRLAVEIKDNNPIVIGLSFGGIVAIEIAKQITVKKVILISSAKQSHEIPWYFKLFPIMFIMSMEQAIAFSPLILLNQISE